MSNRRFERATAKPYMFHEPCGGREVIALFVGGKRSGLVEYKAARLLAERLLALCDARDEALVEALVTS